MELFRRHAAVQPTGFAAYVALEAALMRRFVARGGTLEEFCRRLAPVFHRRFAPLAFSAGGVAGEPAVALPGGSPRLRQECHGLT